MISWKSGSLSGVMKPCLIKKSIRAVESKGNCEFGRCECKEDQGRTDAAVCLEYACSHATDDLVERQELRARQFHEYAFASRASRSSYLEGLHFSVRGHRLEVDSFGDAQVV